VELRSSVGAKKPFSPARNAVVKAWLIGYKAVGRCVERFLLGVFGSVAIEDLFRQKIREAPFPQKMQGDRRVEAHEQISSQDARGERSADRNTHRTRKSFFVLRKILSLFCEVF
jgi:hypothetical protein